MPKKIEITALILFLIFSSYCAFTIGGSWDEIFEMSIGKERLKYLFSFGSYKDFDFYNSRFYPGFYNTISIFLTKMFPSKYEVEIWRLTNLVFSVLTIFGISKLSNELFNKSVGKIVFILCFLNPIFFGHMAMNPKDPMIAFAHIWTAYILIRYLKNQSNQEKCFRYIFLAGLTIGFGTGVRMVFPVTVIPIFLFAILDIFFFKKKINNNFSFNKFVIHIFCVLIIAYLLAITCWAHVHENIFFEPFRLFLDHIKSNSFGVPWILFNGNFYDTLQLPNSYILLNFFYKSPEFILFTYIVFLFLLITNRNFFLSNFNYFWNGIIFILFILLFPIAYFIFLPYRVYDGLRLFLNMVPYFNIIPALVVYFCIKNFSYLKIKFLSSLILFMFFYYLFIFFHLTPYQYTYLNIFNGKFSNSYKKFENDYWGISIKELIKKIPEVTDLISSNKKIKISFCGINHREAILELKKIKNLNYEVKHLNDKDIDYVLMTNRSIGKKNDNQLKNVMTCFERFDGKDLVSVKRNGLILSTLRRVF